MALRDSKWFRALAYTLTGLAILGFVMRIVAQVANGNGADVYSGRRGLPIPYVAALVTCIAVGLVGVFWLCRIAWRWYHRRSDRDAHD